MVLSDADVLAGMVFGPSLANDDVPGPGALTSVELNAEALADGIPSVVGTSLAFLVCHDPKF